MDDLKASCCLIIIQESGKSKPRCTVSGKARKFAAFGTGKERRRGKKKQKSTEGIGDLHKKGDKMRVKLYHLKKKEPLTARQKKSIIT